MMKATKVLIQEHLLILQVLESLSEAKDRIEKGGGPDRVFFDQAIEFSKTFSDRFHHFKEEFLMFGLLAQKEGGGLDLEIGALRYQHERCRSFIRGMEASLKGYAEGDELSITSLLENLSPYVSLLRRHIQQEDGLFFPMVDTFLTEEDHLYLLGRFEKEEERFGGRDFFHASKKQADELARTLQNPNAQHGKQIHHG
jgi:hemerythrin-like domain-containing protein